MSEKSQKLSARLRSRRGLASALIVMLLVLLVFFGVLALVTSAADLRLSQKRAAWNAAYYQADADAAQVMAALDQYCGSLTAADLEAGELETELGAWLDELDYVQTWQISGDGDQLTVEALVARDAGQGQGIAMRLRLLTGDLPAGQNRITVENWSQWQPEFTYGDSEGGLWKG